MEDPQHLDLTLPCLVHDLNNVFQTLVEAADLLSSDPRWSALSAAILRSVERGKNLTSSIQSSEQSSAPLETVLANAVAFVEDSLISRRGPKIFFTSDVEPGLEMRRVWAWERVLINLFSNAVRAMHAGGTIHFRARRSGGNIEITVVDDGPGIAPEILPDIFKPHVSTRGSGLGLHIVASIVRQEDGFVRAVNRPEGGAEFTILVPGASARPAHA
ncbi:MAG TPA: sensor histidine kinase [Bryobacteraceae bacterium]|jgi:signal transduction histidine kinase|nr:sensor histidine kinase [Bryobacteraceae bacterium]